VQWLEQCAAILQVMGSNPTDTCVSRIFPQAVASQL